MDSDGCFVAAGFFASGIRLDVFFNSLCSEPLLIPASGNVCGSGLTGSG